MCFTKSPSAPVNTPAYKPEDAHKHFEVTQTHEDGTVTNLNPRVTPSSSKPPPRSSTTHEQIRM